MSWSLLYFFIHYIFLEHTKIRKIALKSQTRGKKLEFLDFCISFRFLLWLYFLKAEKLQEKVLEVFLFCFVRNRNIARRAEHGESLQVWDGLGGICEDFGRVLRNFLAKFQSKVSQMDWAKSRLPEMCMVVKWNAYSANMIHLLGNSCAGKIPRDLCRRRELLAKRLHESLRKINKTL